MLIEALIICLAVASVSVTVTYSKVFELPRNYIRGTLGDWAGNLISCAYCFSHWVMFIFFLSIHPNNILTQNPSISYFVKYAAMISITAFITWGVKKSFMRPSGGSIEEYEEMEYQNSMAIKLIERLKDRIYSLENPDEE